MAGSGLDIEVGDKIVWLDRDSEEPTDRIGNVVCVLSRMYLVMPVDGRSEKFVFKDDRTIRRYSE